jgi:hypothetical protein
LAIQAGCAPQWALLVSLSHPLSPQQRLLTSIDKYKRFLDASPADGHTLTFDELRGRVWALHYALNNLQLVQSRLDWHQDAMREQAQQLVDICETSLRNCDRVRGQIERLKSELGQERTNMLVYIEACRERQNDYCPGIWRKIKKAIYSKSSVQ